MKLTITDVRKHPGDAAFLLDDGATSILYDTGFAFTGDALVENVRAVLGERKLDYLFLTHSHYDHVLGAPYVCAHYPDVQVIAGEHAAEVFAKPSARAHMRDLDRKFAVQCGVTEYTDRVDELRVDTVVREGDVIHAGDMDFTVVELPGHTKCSIGFYLASEKLLLSSETLGVYDGGDIVFPLYLVGYHAALESIAKVEAMAIDTLLLPHYGLLNHEETAFYLANCRKSATETANEILEILKNGGTHDDAVAYFKKKFYRGNVPTIYPIDAMMVNTNHLVSVIERELYHAEV